MAESQEVGPTKHTQSTSCLRRAMDGHIMVERRGRFRQER